jgi:tetratricopeptide (TPR) repeat protein
MLIPAMARNLRPGRNGRQRAAAALTFLTIGTGATASGAAFAEPNAPPTRPADIDATPQARAAAQLHFQKAQGLYQKGSYRDAMSELDAAAALDPKAKDLYFNLGVVDEKLGRIDEALEQFKRYATFELETQERARVEKYIRRLEGAKEQLARQPAPTFVSAPASIAQPKAIEIEIEKTPNGRIDAATVTAASLSVLGLGAGVVLALHASATRPAPGYVTGRDGTYAELEAKAIDAHRLAIFADVAFGVGAIAGLTAAYLYFSRPRTRPAPSSLSARLQLQLFAGPIPNGATIVASGAF